jgi:hypothetical protein
MAEYRLRSHHYVILDSTIKEQTFMKIVYFGTPVTSHKWRKSHFLLRIFHDRHAGIIERQEIKTMKMGYYGVL